MGNFLDLNFLHLGIILLRHYVLGVYPTLLGGALGGAKHQYSVRKILSKVNITMAQ